MNFYEQLSTHGVNKNQSYDDLTEILLSIIQEHSKGFHHPLLRYFLLAFWCLLLAKKYVLCDIAR